MSGELELELRCQRTLNRILPRLQSRFAADANLAEWQDYVTRMQMHFPSLFERLYQLYGHHYDFFYYVEATLCTTTEMWISRERELKALDALRATDPRWFQSPRMIGATCYIDLFAGNLEGIRNKIPYLTELNITYLHLMPCFRVPEGENDGGYAVSSYRDTDPRLGTMEQLRELAKELRHHGISLVLDFIFNHTSDEHEWAQRALSGDVEYQNFYRMFPDRAMPDQFEQYLPSIFPDEHQGSFTYQSRISKWVWTTFHNYQWDLNYENPEVFVRMLGELLFLANQGVEILRLDAVAFIWKRLGTNCQNLPEAHWIIQAFSAAVKIAAPATVFKSEAIVHPDDVRQYISRHECQLSYNPQLMALLWNGLATRETKVLRQALSRRFQIPEDCQWVNYVRCHDDIGWAFSDDDIAAGGFDPRLHRSFLTEFYTGKIDDSFARGEPFQLDEITGDGRVSGTCASLAGLEKALYEKNSVESILAVRRILLIHGVILTIGGIPLINLGDELACENDYSYKQDPQRASDSRWLHRYQFPWNRRDERRNENSPAGLVYQGLLRLIQIRLQNQAFNLGTTEFIDAGNDHIFGYFRNRETNSALILANFTEQTQSIAGKHLRKFGLRRTVIDQYAGTSVTADRQLELSPYQFVVLARNV
ncbi:MAG: alpha-glucosidase C-terminal domain-containing protein [Planctomycetales bacterium]|nr:alpha-glucosidase C-terminal domain-containing protein [Planctomycetales bacterium]